MSQILHQNYPVDRTYRDELISRKTYNPTFDHWDNLQGHSDIPKPRQLNDIWDNVIPNARLGGMIERDIQSNIASIRNNIIRGLLIQRYLLDFEPEARQQIEASLLAKSRRYGLN